MAGLTRIAVVLLLALCSTASARQLLFNVGECGGRGCHPARFVIAWHFMATMLPAAFTAILPMLPCAGAYADYSGAQQVSSLQEANAVTTGSSDSLPAIALPTLSQIRAFFDALPHPAGATSALPSSIQALAFAGICMCKWLTIMHVLQTSLTPSRLHLRPHHLLLQPLRRAWLLAWLQEQRWRPAWLGPRPEEWHHACLPKALMQVEAGVHPAKLLKRRSQVEATGVIMSDWKSACGGGHPPLERKKAFYSTVAGANPLHGIHSSTIRCAHKGFAQGQIPLLPMCLAAQQHAPTHVESQSRIFP
jgi:hypothetical protein